MKTTDENYRYDELAGFSPVELKSKARASCREIWLSMYKSQLSFSQEAQKTLFARKHIRFLFNPEQRKLLALSSPYAGSDALFLVKSAAANGLSCVGLRDLLERELRYDLSVVRIRIPGEVCRSKPNGIIFDLSRAVTQKPQRKDAK
ncbi:MAG: hypothetical protein IJU38_07180 [Clostridia bacterium]|nr:hypothetical protein [Clostridia bacterium]